MTAANKKLPRWKTRLFLFLLSVALLFTAVLMLDRPEPGLNLLPKKRFSNEQERKDAIKFCQYRILFNFGIRAEWIRGDEYYKKVRIPGDLAIVKPYVALINEVKALKGQLLRAESNPYGNRALLEVGYKNEKLFKLLLVQDKTITRINGKIAIIIDDFGYTFRSHIKDFLNLKQEFTMSILPGLKYSKNIAEEAMSRGKEVMIHMPMQPKENEYDLDDYILLLDMHEEEIRNRIRKAKRALPQAKGLNNHMGSFATQSEWLMNIVMDELSNTDLFFVDSKTEPKSVAYSVARRKKIPALSNQVFLDNVRETPYIRQQLNKLAEIASKKGFAIGIGHPEEVTLNALKTEMPLLEKRGYKFVRVSNLLTKEEVKL